MVYIFHSHVKSRHVAPRACVDKLHPRSILQNDTESTLLPYDVNILS